jgi:hypothetical protein
MKEEKRMSQTPRECPNCHAQSLPGQTFCSNCGTALPTTDASIAPTAAASNPSQPAVEYHGYEPTVAADPISGPQERSTGFPTPPPPPPITNPPYTSGANYNSAYNNYQASPNVTPRDPYVNGQPNNIPYPNQYQGVGTYAPPAKPAKKTSVWVYIGVGLAVLLVLCVGAGIFGIIRANQLALKSNSTTSGGSNKTSGGSSTTGNGNTSATSVNISNLSFVYASDQITVTSIQQASKFSDDNLTTYGQSPNYVRVSFKEQQIAKGDYSNSIFLYTEAFHMLYAGGSVIAAENSQEDLGPNQGVVRTNWVDFPASAKVDLNSLTMRVGSSNEQQMDIPLQNNANVSKYQPKTVTLNTKFSYASMNWTLVSATQSLSMGGDQAKSGKVYITVNLKVTNNSSQEFFGTDFTRLKSDGNVTSPDDGNSETTNLDDIQPGTSNAQGSFVFLSPPSSSGKYTLTFAASTDSSSNISQQDVTFQIQ